MVLGHIGPRTQKELKPSRAAHVGYAHLELPVQATLALRLL